MNTRDIQAELEGYLRGPASRRIVRWLYSTWNAEAEAIKYQEIRNAIKTGALSPDWLAQWQVDYSRFISEVLEEEWREAMEASSRIIRGALPELQWDPAGDRVAQWIKTRGTELAVNLVEEQHQALRAILRHHASLELLPVDELARRLRAVIGLTYKESDSVERFRQQLLDSGLDPMKVEHRTQNYAAWLHRRRAMRIARTELAFAFNFGHFEAMRQAQDQQIFGSGARIVKIFRTAEDERTCPYCGPLEGAVIGLDETFPGATRRLPAVYVPPLHPHCRCAVEYQVLHPGEEVTP